MSDHESPNPSLAGKAAAAPPNGDLQQRIHQLRRALSAGQGDWRLHQELGDALMAAGRAEEAIGDYMTAVNLNPQLGDACLKVGHFFLVRGLYEPAWEWFGRALQIDADSSPAAGRLQAGPPSELRRELIGMLDEWVTANPEDQDRSYLASALLGEQSAKRAPEVYVSKLFDNYAEKFDEHLKRLSYRGPELIAEAVAKSDPGSGGDSPHRWEILDIGCGTGLVGVLLRSHASRLVGVDLSEKMVTKAAERGVYDELCAAEMNGLMHDRPQAFDIVTAGDVLTYLGDLEEFSVAVGTTLRPGGRLFAIFEALDVDGDEPYHLHPTGRFSHRESYVIDCLCQHGFAVEVVSRSPSRVNQGQPVPSFLIVAEKS